MLVYPSVRWRGADRPGLLRRRCGRGGTHTLHPLVRVANNRLAYAARNATGHGRRDDGTCAACAAACARPKGTATSLGLRVVCRRLWRHLDAAVHTIASRRRSRVERYRVRRGRRIAGCGRGRALAVLPCWRRLSPLLPCKAGQRSFRQLARPAARRDNASSSVRSEFVGTDDPSVLQRLAARGTDGRLRRSPGA